MSSVETIGRLTDDEDQQMLRATVRAFLEEKSTEADVRRLMVDDVGYDPAVWRQMSEQMGLPGLALPEEHGGGGFSFRELCIVAEEMGRALLCAPFLSSVMAGQALLHGGDDAIRAELLPRLADGTLLATLAVAERGAGWEREAVRTRAEGSADGSVHLYGEKHLVVDGHIAEVVLVAARDADDIGLFLVDGRDPTMERRPLDALDGTRKLVDLKFERTPVRRIGAPGAGWAAVATALDVTRVVLAAEQVGGSQKALDLAVEYAQVRVQFGRPIGSFQAIKHLCADMLLDVELARSVAAWAATEASRPDGDLGGAAALAQATCSEAFARVAAATIQVHGGIGFTWEHPAHLYYRRARASEAFLGHPGRHLEAVARGLGLLAPPEQGGS
jgi:alkylation response protein AidB-like acyl-CoA dehydrogenase